jgi:hypothetical protein
VPAVLDALVAVGELGLYRPLHGSGARRGSGRHGGGAPAAQTRGGGHVEVEVEVAGPSECPGGSPGGGGPPPALLLVGLRLLSRDAPGTWGSVVRTVRHCGLEGVVPPRAVAPLLLHHMPLSKVV